MGRNLSGKQRPSPSLFDPPHYDDPSDDEPVLVDLRGVRLERLRDFGDAWMALGLWRLLGMDTLLQGLAEPGTVEAMEKKYGRANRIWVMDRGMVSEKNLRFLRERNGQYIVGTPKAMLRQFEEYLTRKDWHEVQEGVEVQLVPGPEGDEMFVLARSTDRREKEKAMHQRFVDRLEAALKKMQASAESGRLKDEAVANRRLGRLMCQYWRAGGAFDVKIERLSPPQGKARLRCGSVTSS